MMVWTTLAALHAFIEGIDLFSIQLIWPIILASGLGFICFFIFALRTYVDGDFSSYYPITRADPLFIAIISFLFLGKLYSFILIFGIILVFIGAFFSSVQKWMGHFVTAKNALFGNTCNDCSWHGYTYGCSCRSRG